MISCKRPGTSVQNILTCLFLLFTSRRSGFSTPLKKGRRMWSTSWTTFRISYLCCTSVLNSGSVIDIRSSCIFSQQYVKVCFLKRTPHIAIRLSCYFAVVDLIVTSLLRVHGICTLLAELLMIAYFDNRVCMRAVHTLWFIFC